MQIQGPGNVPGPDPIRPDRIRSSHHQDLPAPTESADKVEISDLARFKAVLDKVPDIRHERVDELRRLIEAGTYDDESEEKIEQLVERLLDEVFP